MSDELVRCDVCGSMVREEPHGMSLKPHRCTSRQTQRAEAQGGSVICDHCRRPLDGRGIVIPGHAVVHARCRQRYLGRQSLPSDPDAHGDRGRS